MQAFRIEGRNTHIYQLLGISDVSKNGHMTYTSHMKVRFINLVTKLGKISVLWMQGVGGLGHGMHGGVPPHTSSHAPVAQGPGSLGALDATSWAFFLIFWHRYMPQICLGIFGAPLTRHTWPTTCAHRLPSAMGAGNSCVSPHAPVVCPMCSAMGSGMACICGPSRHLWGIFWPTPMPGICPIAPFHTHIPSTAVRREWVLAGCKPGFQERVSGSRSTPCMGGL